MTNFKIILIILVSCIFAASAFADIYEWTDENGVKHYSNYAPPAESRVLMKTKEEPYDEAADRARIAAEQQQLLELARQQIAAQCGERGIDIADQLGAGDCHRGPQCRHLVHVLTDTAKLDRRVANRRGKNDAYCGETDDQSTGNAKIG